MGHDLEVAATLDNLRRVTEFVVETAQAAGLSDHAIYQCELAVDEVCANIIEHGVEASGDSTSYFIRTVTRLEDNQFVITISDNCIPFNPLKHLRGDTDSLEAKMKPGGWGIYFANEQMDSLEYSYQNGQNHLTLRKQRSQG